MCDMDIGIWLGIMAKFLEIGYGDMYRIDIGL
jgi:hypothetical protein